MFNFNKLRRSIYYTVDLLQMTWTYKFGILITTIYSTLISQNIMTTCLRCSWSSLCCQNSVDPPKNWLYKTPESVLCYL